MKRGASPIVWLCLLVWAPAALAQGTIKDFDLKDGVNDENKIAAPLFDASAMAPVYIDTIARQYDTKALMFKKGGKSGVWNGQGPEYLVDPKLDLGKSLREALERQGAAMGLKMAKAPAGAWVISGTLTDMRFLTEQTAGATLFYGTSRVNLMLRDPNGATTTETLTFHIYKAIWKFGYTKTGRAKEALALALVEAAHESLAFLQMRVWHLPLHASTQSLAAKLESSTLNEIYRLGLTGSSDVGKRLLALLPQRAKEDDRVFIIEALARLRTAEAVPVLDQRYKSESEDGRWATVKAMSYIGGDAARAVLKERALTDEYPGASRLAEDILAPR
jgi:hypothetical protein